MPDREGRAAAAQAQRTGTGTAPVCVGIPTYARGARVLSTIERVLACDPAPAEVVVHVDASDGRLERDIAAAFPAVRILSSASRVGPGGGRHRCIGATTQPFFASFDDDSWPMDADFFAEAVRIFEAYPKAAVLAASITHRGESPAAAAPETDAASSFAGCGYALRVEAYREIPGNVDRPWAYGIEEVDVSLQLYAAGWDILRCRSLRAFHDTDLTHHNSSDLMAAVIQNVALLAMLRYPVSLWPHALAQVGNRIWYTFRRGAYRGVVEGVLGLPKVLSSFASQRRPLPAAAVRAYLRSRKAPSR